ncbi:MAG: hypothetical protein N3E49_05335 [Bacteroidia bacterium]|nr:hypothetical protein [Bacteroidia bacterium]
MLRLLSLFSLPLFAQALCGFSHELGYVVWGIYHPLERGRGEALAHSIAQALLSDSVLREIIYIHSVRYEMYRMGPWFLIQGTATPEGLYAFLMALRTALDRFPQRLQSGVSPSGFHSSGYSYFRLVYEDTARTEFTPLTVSRAFYEYWREGRLRIFLRGRLSAPLLRAARSIVEGEAMPFTYVPPELPPPSYQPPRQGAAVVYVRWSLSQLPNLATWIALWSHSQALTRFLCEERQLTCRVVWVPLPIGLEGWIETTLPAATEQAVRDFLARPYIPPRHSPVAFFSWSYEPEHLFLSSWWACIWGLPSLPKDIPALSQRELRKAARYWTTIAFAVRG